MGGQKVRFVFAFFCWFLIYALAVIVGTQINSILVTLALWALAMRFLVTPFLVSVPEVTGLVTINLLSGIGGGRYYCYPTGMHFRFPWEQVKVGNYINLRLITDSKKETYPARDGPLMLTEWSFQYRPLWQKLDRYIAVDETTINRGLVDVGSSVLSANIASMEADDCKTYQHRIETDLRAQFERMSPSPEELYGIEMVRVALADLDYEEKYQKARASERVSQKLKDIATQLMEEAKLKGKEISFKEALNAAMIINGDVTKAIQEVEGQGGEALAALLMAMSKGGKE